MLYFILFFCSLFESIWLNVAFYFLLNFIFLVIQFYLNWYTALFHSSILTAVMSMSELIVYGIIKRFAPHFLDNGRDFNHLLVFTVFNKLIFFTVIYLLFLFIEHKKLLSKREPFPKSRYGITRLRSMGRSQTSSQPKSSPFMWILYTNTHSLSM